MAMWLDASKAEARSARTRAREANSSRTRRTSTVPGTTDPTAANGIARVATSDLPVARHKWSIAFQEWVPEAQKGASTGASTAGTPTRRPFHAAVLGSSPHIPAPDVSTLSTRSKLDMVARLWLSYECATAITRHTSTAVAPSQHTPVRIERALLIFGADSRGAIAGR